MTYAFKAKYHEEFEKNMKNKPSPPKTTPTAATATMNQMTGFVDTSDFVRAASESKQSQATRMSRDLPLIATFKAGERVMDSQAQRRIGSIADYDPSSRADFDPIRYQYHHQLQHQQAYELRSGSSTSSNTSGSDINLSAQTHGASPPRQLSQQSTAYNVCDQYSAHSFAATNIVQHADHALFISESRNTNGTAITAVNQFPTTMAANNNGDDIGGDFEIIQTTVYRAIYDYDAKEDDEISFREGDKFTNCEQIDVGWMIGLFLVDLF